MLVYSLQAVTPEQARTYLRQKTRVETWGHLPPEAQELTRNPQDLALVGEIVQELRPEEMPTQRAALYQELLRRDSALKGWVQIESPEIRAIYGVAFHMLEEGRRTLGDEELPAIVQVYLAQFNSNTSDTVNTVITALKRSRMFKQEQEKTLGLVREVTGFQHELTGKYLAACYLDVLIKQKPQESRARIMQIAQETRWFDVLCFLIDRLDSAPFFNTLLVDIRVNTSPLWPRLVAYALQTKPVDFVGQDIREAYLTAKTQADLYGTLAA